MEKEKKLYCVANAHLDTQWNWTVRDSIRECILNTLVMNFDLFEKYPSYVMNFEGAFRYKLAKEYYPDLYEKLKKAGVVTKLDVFEGMWHVFQMAPIKKASESMDRIANFVIKQLMQY